MTGPEIVGGVSSQAGLSSIRRRPRPSQGDWERMLADEHAQGMHGDGCACPSIDTESSEQEQSHGDR